MIPQFINCRRPTRLYRYSKNEWLLKSLYKGEFRLVPASDYNDLVGDIARHDNELVRIQKSPADQVEITHVKTGQRLKPIGEVTYQSEIMTNYYTLCFSSTWDIALFDEFSGADTCLLIHDTEAVCERIHFFAENILGDWSGLDAAVIYGGKSDFTAFYLKDPKYSLQNEWRFTWVPPQACQRLVPFNIHIGSIERYAELVPKPVAPGARCD
jgi:hypothetical protein